MHMLSYVIHHMLWTPSQCVHTHWSDTLSIPDQPVCIKGQSIVHEQIIQSICATPLHLFTAHHSYAKVSNSSLVHTTDLSINCQHSSLCGHMYVSTSCRCHTSSHTQVHLHQSVRTTNQAHTDSFDTGPKSHDEHMNSPLNTQYTPLFYRLLKAIPTIEQTTTCCAASVYDERLVYLHNLSPAQCPYKRYMSTTDLPSHAIAISSPPL